LSAGDLTEEEATAYFREEIKRALAAERIAS
jgi:hypothetical protein